MYLERRSGAAGSRLQSRLVLTFALLSVVPTILVGTFSAFFFHNGLQEWFSDRVRLAVNESLVVAEAYLKEHQQAVATDALSLAQGVSRSWTSMSFSEHRMDAFMRQETLERGLSEAVVFDRSGQVLARAGFTFSLRSEDVPIWAIEKAQRGEVALLTSDDDDRVRALIRLDVMSAGEYFLYIGRFVDATVIAHMEKAQDAVQAFQALEIRRWDVELTFTLVYILVSLLLLLAAMWLGLTLSNQLIQPISELIGAAEKAGKGDLTHRVKEYAYTDEISLLSRTFNRMISQISDQREDLLEANQQLDERRRFTEAVLTGVSAGVIGLDAHGRIRAINPSAASLLAVSSENAIGCMLSDVASDLGSAFTEMRHSNDRSEQKPVSIYRDGHERVLLLRVSADYANHQVIGYVLTFDDITELQTAQRAAAWSDVARQIAHEIKNPLTPIQLSAERLKHKYESQVVDGVEVFRKCTDTIVRQVDDIRRLVDEFSSFARMPTPEFAKDNLALLAQEAVVLQQTAFPQLSIQLRLSGGAATIICDRGLIAQALTNILKNAIESVDARLQNTPNPAGEIIVTVDSVDDIVRVAVEDNGIGLPKEGRERLTNPYVTTRKKGTGLGLAIVKKIAEDHNGKLLMLDRSVALDDNAEQNSGSESPVFGARIVMEFPKPSVAPSNAATE
jgi:two-component system nitrogen regulation sensor histidine kinase NtrY